MENSIIPKDDLIKDYYEIICAYIPIYDKRAKLHPTFSLMRKYRCASICLHNIKKGLPGWSLCYVIDKTTNELLYAAQILYDKDYLYIDSFVKIYEGFNLSLTIFSIIASLIRSETKYIAYTTELVSFGLANHINNTIITFCMTKQTIDMINGRLFYIKQINNSIPVSKINSEKYEIIVGARPSTSS